MAATDGKRRVLGLGADPGGLSPGVKTLILFAALLVLGALFALSNPEASLRHLKAASRKGRVTNVPTAGAVENVQRLIAARKGCTAQFALVQEGVDLPEG